MRRISYYIEDCNIELPLNVTTASTSVIAPLLADTLPVIDGKKIVVSRDISYIAQNLQKFQNISNVQQAAIVDRLRQVGGNTFDNFSDEELFESMRSRYCQLPSEVSAYIDYINSNIDLVKKGISDSLASKVNDKELVPPVESAASSSDVVS